MIVAGRSDATLNLGGVCFGTAEFYRVLEGLPEVEDSLVIPIQDAAGGNGEVLLFVVLREGISLSPDLSALIARELRTALSPRHIPDAIHAVRSSSAAARERSWNRRPRRS